MTETLVAVGLGSNLGDRAATLRGAIRDLGIAGRVEAVSSIYQTAPVGGPEQPPFLNAVCLLVTDHDPETLLDLLAGIEARWGRTRDLQWGPRTLDLDLLLFGDETVDTARLVVPHPRLAERRFVLEPLVEVWPDARVGSAAAADLLSGVGDQHLERIAGPSWIDMDPRGTPWVIGQAVMIGLLVLSLLDTGSLGDATWMPWAGRALIVLAIGAFVAGMLALGRNLTGFPEPTEFGQLVTSGIYRLIRHPLYTGNVLLFLGVALHQRSRAGLIVAALALGFFWLKAGHEEVRLRLRFPGYGDYQAATAGRLFPGL